jgi:hypothetical protein
MKPELSSCKWSKVGGKFKSTSDSRYRWMKNGGHVRSETLGIFNRGEIVPSRYVIRIIGRLENRVTRNPQCFSLGIKFVIRFSPYVVIGHVMANEQSSHTKPPSLS